MSQHACDPAAPVSDPIRDDNYNLTGFCIDELSDDSKQRLPAGHRIPMGIFATAGTYWLLLNHDERLVRYISRDPNERVPNPQKVSHNGFYVTIQSDGFVLNHRRNRLERVAVLVWGNDENKRNLGVNIITAALVSPPRRYLRKARVSAPQTDSKTGLTYQVISGHYLTMIKEHEVL